MQDQFYQMPFQKRSRASDFRSAARTALAGHWWLVIGVFLLASVLSVEYGFSLPQESEQVGMFLQNPSDFLQKIKSADELLLELGVNDFVKRVMRWLIGGESIKVLAFEESVVWIVAFFVGAPVTVGFHNFLIGLAERNPQAGVKSLFAVFSNCYWHSVALRVLITLLYLGTGAVAVGAAYAILWIAVALKCGWLVWGALVSLLFGGVLNLIVQYKMALCYHIVDDFPNLTAVDAIRNSFILMKGNTWRYCRLQFSFIGWVLVAMFTFGVGIILLVPYMMMANTMFYAEVSGRNTAKEVEFPSINPDDYFPSI